MHKVDSAIATSFIQYIVNQYLETLENNRKVLVDLTKALNEEQLNFIPRGHNNNIIWNMGHMLVVSESLLYKTSGSKPPLHGFDINRFGRNTRPDQVFNQSQISEISEALLRTVAIFNDTTSGMAATDRGTNEGFVLTQDTLQFLLFHENIHYKTVIRLIRAVHP